VNIAALLAGLLSGIVGAMGLGGGAVLIIYLTLFTETEQLTAQGINLLFFIPIAVIAVLIYAKRKLIEWKTVFKTASCGVIGSALGIYLGGFIGGEWISKIFGLFLCILGLIEIFKKNGCIKK
jgi:uncharacterized membrane protein YfcA